VILPLSLREAAGIFLRGLAMGASDMIPGVSGGTMAFITGIYGRLISAISGIHPSILLCLFRGDREGFMAGIREIDPWFLAVLLAGIGTAALVMSRLILFLLETAAGSTYAFFFGLILASAILIAAEIESHDLYAGAFVIIGLIAGYGTAGLSPVLLPHTVPLLFATGMLAFCAMILPGISGAYITLILHQYEYLLDALRSCSIPEIIAFLAGGVTGLLLFTRFLRYLLDRYPAAVLAFLTGLMLGSTRLLFGRILENGGFTPATTTAAVLGFGMVGVAELLHRWRSAMDQDSP